MKGQIYYFFTDTIQLILWIGFSLLENVMNLFGWQQGNRSMCHHHCQAVIIDILLSSFFLMCLWFIKVLMIIIKSLVRSIVWCVCICTHCRSIRSHIVINVNVGSARIACVLCTCRLCLLRSKLIHQFASNLWLFLFHLRTNQLYHMFAIRQISAKKTKRCSQKFPTNKFDSFDDEIASIWWRGGIMLIAYGLHYFHFINLHMAVLK